MTSRRYETSEPNQATTKLVLANHKRPTTAVVVAAHPNEIPSEMWSAYGVETARLEKFERQMGGVASDRGDVSEPSVAVGSSKNSNGATRRPTAIVVGDGVTAIRFREAEAQRAGSNTSSLLVLCSDLALDEARAAIALWRKGDETCDVIAVPMPSDQRSPDAIFRELGEQVTHRMSRGELGVYLAARESVLANGAVTSRNGVSEGDGLQALDSRHAEFSSPRMLMELFAAALDGCSEAVIGVGKDGQVLVANQTFREMFGVPSDLEVPGTALQSYFNEPSQELLLRRLQDAERQSMVLASSLPQIESLVGIRSDGTGILVRSEFRTSLGVSDLLLTITMRDVSNERRNEDELRLLAARLEMRSEDLERAIRTHTVELHAKNAQLKLEIEERKRAQQELAFRANYDPLTRLPNRSLFFDRLTHRIDRLERNQGELFAVMFLDLDGFKLVNDSMGHHIGDQLLVEVAGRLRRCVRPLDTIARMGGDEFTILLDQIHSPTDVVRISQRIQMELAAPLELGGQKIFLTVSVGIAINNVLRRSPQDYLRDADAAMYRAKEKGKARYEIFDHGMHGKAVNRLKLEADLREALVNRQFELHYQPIVSLHTGRLAGLEALVRWHSPSRGMVPPLEFIPILEETGLIVEMGEWAMFESLGQLRAWTDAGIVDDDVSMAVNVSRRQLLSAHLTQTIGHALQQFKLDGPRLKVEITESSVMENREMAVHVLDQLRSRSIHLSMDDFGTGHSSLSCLHQYPFTTLKIDREFVRECAEKPSHLEVVRAILSLARVLELEVVAEGVETNEQLNLLRTLGCDYAQGYFIARPMPSDQAGKFLRDYNSSKYSG